jgi:NADH-quinone oxidoreductase subunit J
VRPLVRVAALALLVAACGGGSDAPTPTTTIDISGKTETVKAPAEKKPGEGGLGAMIAFFVISSLVLLGAIVTIFSRNAVNAVMALVATFFSLAALYTLLSAHFLAAIQVLVYAGAIMTLFVFVVMLLNREENQRLAPRGIVVRALGAGMSAWSMIIVGNMVRTWHQTGGARTDLPSGDGNNAWGGVARVGEVLFKDYLFPFEAVSILLLVAVVGAVVVARIPRRRVDVADADTEVAVEEGGH